MDSEELRPQDMGVTRVREEYCTGSNPERCVHGRTQIKEETSEEEDSEKI